jgi:PD-(D/E)XK nuclease superfamily
LLGVSFQVTFDAGAHKYWIDGEPVPSVTQILSIVDKSGPLSWWGQGIGVKGVCELRRLGEEIPWDDPEGIVKLLTVKRLTTNHVKSQAGTRGSSIHRALEQFLERGKVPNAADSPEPDRGYVRALARALVDLAPEAIETEQIVGSKQHGFAGTFDLLATVDGQITRWDSKTGKHVYPEAHLQLAAYEVAAVESGHPASERQIVVRLGADGEYEVAEVCATFDQFLAVLGAWRAMQTLRADVKGKRVAA